MQQINNNPYSIIKKGWVEIRDKKYFMRSKWEMNYAYYLEFLIKQKEIKDWAYEDRTFWFKGIKRGVMSYKPDFKIIKNDNTIEYHEIKGYMDSRSKTKIKRMKKYYPEIKLIVIEKAEYSAIKKYSRLIKGWVD